MPNPIRSFKAWSSRPDRRTLLMCGIGGTGKTMLVNALVEKFGERAHVFRSTNREAIKDLGFESEADVAKLSPKDVWEVQYAVFRYYVSKLDQFVSELNVKYSRDLTTRILITERSPLDYLSYWAGNIPPEIISLNEIHKIIKPVGDMMFSGTTRVVHFPWPTPWYESGATRDGFRMVNRDRDEATNRENVIALSWMRQQYPNSGETILLEEAASTSLEDRVAHVVSCAGL